MLTNQQRLRSGIFVRQRESGEIESTPEFSSWLCVSHRYFLDPEKGVFYAQVQQAKIPLLPLLRNLDATDQQLRKAWGDEILNTNGSQDNPRYLQKYFNKFLPKRLRDEPRLSDSEKAEKLREAVLAMRLDPEVTRRTMGRDIDHLDLEAILDVTKETWPRKHCSAAGTRRG